MITLRVTVDSSLRGTGDIAEAFDRDVSATLAELGQLGRRLVVERAPAGVSSAGGGLRGSIFTEQRGTPDRRAQIIGSGLFYAPIVEEGRRPGRRPPADALRLWVTRKLGIVGERVTQVSYLVARKIGRRGYPGFKMFARAAQQLEPIVAQKTEELGRRLQARFGSGA